MLGHNKLQQLNPDACLSMLSEGAANLTELPNLCTSRKSVISVCLQTFRLYIVLHTNTDMVTCSVVRSISCLDFVFLS